MPLPVTTMGAWQLMVGAWLSVTITCNMHWVALLEASVARKTTLVVPTGKADPLAGPDVRTDVPEVGLQLSV